MSYFGIFFMLHIMIVLSVSLRCPVVTDFGHLSHQESSHSLQPFRTSVSVCVCVCVCSARHVVVAILGNEDNFLAFNLNSLFQGKIYTIVFLCTRNYTCKPITCQ